MNRTYEIDTPWSIILAGGEGERLRPLTERWLGRHMPKQYCTFVGTRSMLQHTIDRASRISTPERTIVVAAQAHAGEALSQLVPAKAGSVIFQPRNRDTAVGIFLALNHVRAQDPKATVILFPSDHFVYPEERFLEVVKTAVQAARQSEHWSFLLAASPDRPEPDYGWIELGRHLARINGCHVLAVKGFLEKPAAEQCLSAMTGGALWNTMVMAVNSETLWRMGWFCFPEVMRLFEVYEKAIGTDDETSVLESIYEVMPPRNFSIHLLGRITSQLAAVEMTGVLWCDWGRPERIWDTLLQVGKRPAFSWA